jgi:hypothetical protein
MVPHRQFGNSFERIDKGMLTYIRFSVTVEATFYTLPESNTERTVKPIALAAG